jgi:hypothetical protein
VGCFGAVVKAEFAAMVVSELRFGLKDWTETCLTLYSFHI